MLVFRVRYTAGAIVGDKLKIISVVKTKAQGQRTNDTLDSSTLKKKNFSTLHSFFLNISKERE